MNLWKKVLFACFIMVFIAAPQVFAENFYEQISRTVLRLEHFEKTMKEGSDKVHKVNKSDGTGFFVRCGGELFVVSVRHVAETDYDLHSRIEYYDSGSGKKERVILRLPRGAWIFHPRKGDKENYFVDVAAIKVPWPKDKAVMSFLYDPEGEGLSAMNQLPFTDPDPPLEVLAFGFPLNIGFELAEQRPLGRSGIIAMKTGKRFLKLSFSGGKRFAEGRCYLVDLEAFPGNSGSPILSHNSIFTNPQLVGILSAANPSLDYAVVEPVSRIREVLDTARKKSLKKGDYWFPVRGKRK